MAICEQCSTVYEAKRATSRFCSDKCRTTYGRVSEQPAVELANEQLSEQLSEQASIPGFGTPTCQCKMCQGSASPAAINHGPLMDSQELAARGFNRNRVSLPGDPDYNGVALQEKYRPNWAHPEGVDFQPNDPKSTRRLTPPGHVPEEIKQMFARPSS